MEDEGDALVDPLANYWGISLFTSPSLPPSQPYNSDLDLHTIHTHLKSMALRSPAKLVQEAKLVLDDDPNLFVSEILHDSIFQTTSISQTTYDAGEDGDFRREQRPGLGFKRPRFSMKPTKKPSVESLLPTLDLDSLKDPAEFFLAHERLENAKREIQKQLGGASYESDQDSLSTRPRQRRPGLLRNDQLPIRYKHRYPRETSESVLSSQEDALGSQTLDPVAEKTDVDEAYMISSDKEVMDSSAIKGNELDELLDGLLSCNSEDLEGDGAISLLQERLQIKPVAVDKFSFPIFLDSQVTDLKSLQRNKSKPRKALSDIDNLLKGIITNKKTPLKKSAQSTVQQLSSPTPPRNPFASILSLQKHISRSRQSLDSFSLDEGMENSESNLVSGRPNELNARMIEHVVAVGTSTVLDKNRNYTNTSEIPKEDNSRTSEAKNTVTNGTSTSRTSMEGNSREPRFDVDIDSSELHFDIDVGGIGMGKRVMDGTEDRSNIGPNMLEDVPKEDNSRTSEAKNTVTNGTSTSRTSMEGNSREPRFDVDIDSSKLHFDIDGGGIGMGKRVMDGTEDRSNIEPNMIEDVVAVGKTSTVLDTDINCTHASDISKEESYEKSSNDLIVSSIEDITAVGRTSLAEDTARNCTSAPQKSIMDNSRELRFDDNVDSYEPLVHTDVDVGGSDIGESVMDDIEDSLDIDAQMVEDVVAVIKPSTVLDTCINVESSGMGERVMDDVEDRFNIEANESCQSKDKAGNMQTFTTSIPTDDTNLNMVSPPADQSDPAGYQASAVDKRASRSEDDQSNPTEYQAHIVQEKTDDSMEPVKNKKRVKSRAEKNVSKRKSLAASGTSWNDGVRRSTRIRTRPLEYWKGERQVYGRVHQSLATVIGVKCISPGTDGKPTMKVKSYVSDLHKELLDLASLY